MYCTSHSMHRQWSRFQNIAFTERNNFKHIGLNVHKTPPACTLCMFTVHRKLSVAHTGDFNNTNYAHYTLK